MRKNGKKLVVCTESKRKERDILKNIYKIHTINNLNYYAKLVKVGDYYFIFISSRNTIEENKFILYYAIEYFLINKKDTIVDFKINNKNINIYRKVVNKLKMTTFKSSNINKLVGDLNEKF